MKRFLCAFLAIAILLLFSACSTKKPDNVIEGSREPEVTPPQTTEVTIEEAVLVEEKGVKITAKSITYYVIFGPELNLFIENDSGKELTFQCRYASVNGYMIDTMMSVDVANGKKANDTLTFMDSDLELSGIKNIADMEILFHIFDSDWDTYLDTQQIMIKTSAADTHNYIYDDSGDVAYNGNGIKVVVKGLEESSSLLGPSLVVYIANTGDKDVTVQAKDVSVNGFMVEAIFSATVLSGKHSVDTITFLTTDLEANDITKIDNVELSFHIFDESSWDTIVNTDPVAINF